MEQAIFTSLREKRLLNLLNSKSKKKSIIFLQSCLKLLTKGVIKRERAKRVANYKDMKT